MKKRNVLLIITIILTLGFFTYGMFPSNTTALLRPMLRNVESRVVSYRTSNYESITTKNFIIRYDNAIDDKIIDLVIRTAEDKYEDTVEIFQYTPEDKILIVLYDDPSALMKNTMLYGGPTPMGVYYGDTIHLINPTYWVKDLENIDKIFYSEGPLLHELVHLFTDHVGKGNFPLWFTEGVSLYFEYKIDGYEWGKEVAFEDGGYTLEVLTSQFHHLDDYLAYTQSFRIVRGFVEEHGIEALITLIRELGEGKDMKEFIYLF